MKKNSLKYQAYQSIKDKIVNCIYPPGMLINEEQLVAELHTSRTPIRDALSRLEQEGLISILPKKGIMISNVTIDNINMIYETRQLLECYCIQQYGCLIPSCQFMNYYNLYNEYLRSPNPADYSYSKMDAQFHLMFVEASNNQYLIDLYSVISSQVQRSRILCGKTSESRLLESTKEHLLITEFALKKEWQEAQDAMKNHLKISKNISFDTFMKTQTDADLL